MEFEKLLSQLPIIEEANDLKHQLETLKPFPQDVEQKIWQKFRLDWNYNSNAIEGNPYSYGETLTFILHGITAKGKTLKDHLDVKGHNDGINFILSIVKEARPITESDIRALHKMILVEPYEVDTVTPSGLPSKKMILIGEYKKEANHVKTKTGEIHYYATPEETPILMAELMEWYLKTLSVSEIHPLVIAALFHHKFTEIHPFDDGNGRMARLLMNLILLKSGFPPVVVRNEDKNNYYEALSLADAGEKRQIVEYLGALLVHSLTIYLKGAKGESIDDDTDVDKEIALFRAGLNASKSNPIKKTKALEEQIIKESFMPLFAKVESSTNKFKDLFESVDEYYLVDSIKYDKDLSKIVKLIYSSFYNGEIGYQLGLSQFIKDNMKSIKLNFNVSFSDYYYSYEFYLLNAHLFPFFKLENRHNYSETIDSKEIAEVASKIVKAIISELSTENL